jgi:hypothetical protein
MSLRVLTIVTILLIGPLTATSRAHWLNDLERWVGVGTSDGYHSRTGCPPKRAQVHSPQAGHLPPTWASASPQRPSTGPRVSSAGSHR